MYYNVFGGWEKLNLAYYKNLEELLQEKKVLEAIIALAKTIEEHNNKIIQLMDRVELLEGKIEILKNK